MIAKSWLSRCWQWKVGGCVAIFGTLSIGISKGVLAQIVPDNTLGRERSVVTPNVNINGIPSTQIDGGATRGANLFQSFSQFNVGAGRGAYFSNPAGILNIFSRVTGASRSDILGRLGVLGDANLFLINPNGIVFGQNASLDLQGSFLATTANAIKLGDTGLFSASQPATSNLLSVSPSALWFNAVAAQPIVNRSLAPSPFGQLNSNDGTPGLQVQPGRTLALVGGNVLLEGGNLTAAGGRIELGSVAGVGQVSLTSTGNRLVLGYDSINNFGNILLSNKAFVDASGEGGGGVQVRGGRLEMTQGSNIRADTLGAENGGEVLVRATEVDLSEGSKLTADVASTGTGAGGDLTIDTQRLLVQGGAQVSANSFGSGKGGSLQITATDSVELIGTSADGVLSALGSQSRGNGDAGNVRIDTRRLLVQGGALVSAGTFGQGKGGSLQITATDSVELIGTSAGGEFSSGLFTQSEPKASGDAGDLTISTRHLMVRDGAEVSSACAGSGKGGSLQITATDSVELFGSGTFASGTFAITFPSGLTTQSQGTGDAGNLTIHTRRLLVRDGAQVSAGTIGEGKGGSLQITAVDSVELIGTTAVGQFPSGLFTQSRGSGNAGDLTIDTGRLLVRDGAVVSASTQGAGKGGRLIVRATDSVELTGTRADDLGGLFTQSQGSGDAGDLTIDTSRLLVRDGAVVSSGSFGEGTAGNIDITARDTLQADNGTIRTDSTQTQGGAITIRAGNIRLFGNSDIISNVASGAGGGGDIDLKAGSIVAFGDSDILAYARDGKGGNITLDTPVFFGENYRPAPRGTDPRTLQGNNRVDVNATGAINGIITTPDVSFIQNSLTQLPNNQINTDSILANSCIVRRNQPTQGSFIVKGAGGLPQRPGDSQVETFPTVDVETLPTDTSTNTQPNRPWQKGDPIVEPQGVYRLPNGKLVMSRECSHLQ